MLLLLVQLQWPGCVAGRDSPLGLMMDAIKDVCWARVGWRDEEQGLGRKRRELDPGLAVWQAQHPGFHLQHHLKRRRMLSSFTKCQSGVTGDKALAETRASQPQSPSHASDAKVPFGSYGAGHRLCNNFSSYST